MPKIKLTKSELKSQRDDMKQYARFLPTLQLKKQQLQMEMLRCRQEMKAILEEEDKLKDSISSWIALFGDDESAEFLKTSVKLGKVDTERKNIAGVDVPVFVSANFKIAEYDLFVVDSWIDDAIERIKEVVSLKAKHDIMQKQYDLIANELRTTTQRVNLFEKVKIPECKENIRTIQIYLGDQQTAAVGRSKIAKKKMQKVSGRGDKAA
jgi:V/A-type H+-transporting ATPase subunit D